MLNKLSSLSDHALVRLKEAVEVELERRHHKIFALGNLVRFEAKNGEEVFLRILRHGPKNVIGEQVNEFGKRVTDELGRPRRWRVHPTLLTPVMPTPPVKPATAGAGSW